MSLVGGVSANAGGDRVAIGGGGGVSVYDGSGQRLARLDVPGVHVLAYQPGASSPKLACAAWERERSLSLWSAEGERLAALEGHTGLIKALAWSPDGAWLASGGDRTVRLW